MEENKLKLDLSKLTHRKRVSVTTKEALKDVEPFEWSEEVLSGKKKVIMEYGG